MADCYYSLEPTTADSPWLTREAYDLAAKSWLCTSCTTIKLPPIALDVELRRGRIEKPLSFVTGTRLGLVHDELLNCFARQTVERDLLLGKVLGPHGKELSGWHTYRGKQRILVRGGENPSVRVCDQCGDLVYDSVYKTGQFYLSPFPPIGVDIFEGDFVTMVVSEMVFHGIDGKKWKRMHCEKLSVKNKPDDGLGDLQLKTFA